VKLQTISPAPFLEQVGNKSLVTLSLPSFEPFTSHPSSMLIDLNTLPEEGGEEVPDLNTSPAEREEEQDVVAAYEVGGADHFDLHPAQNDEQAQIHQGKHICLYPKLYF
jgi:hypothetical protein